MLTTIMFFVALNHDWNATRFAMMMATALGCYCFCSEVCLRGFIELRKLGFRVPDRDVSFSVTVEVVCSE